MNSETEDHCSDPGCVLCRLQFDPDMQSEPGNSILAQGEFHYVICGLGAFLPGYALLVTRTHIDNFSRLSAAQLDEYCFIRSKLESKFREIYKTLLIYEHGTVGATQAGSCVSHAHLHFMATNISLIAHLRSLGLDCSENSTDPFVEPAKQSYIYVKEENMNAFLFDVKTHLPRQFLRREISKMLNKAEFWDYKLYPFLENMHDTEKALEGFLS